MGIRRGTGGGRRALLVVIAHLDTVFPEGTDVKVKRAGYAAQRAGHRRRHARARADPRARSARWTRRSSRRRVRRPLRRQRRRGRRRGPARHQVPAAARASTRTASSRCWSSTATSRTGSRSGGVGSKRYRVTFKGPGGHSYGAFGLVNPALCHGQARSRGSSRIEVPARRRRRPTASASSAAARRSTRFPSKSAWTSTCGRSRAPS